MFSKSKKKIRQITLLSGGSVLYSGPLAEIPLREELILQMSSRFFNDPNPCYIHRGAVRVRLTAELEELLPASDQAALCARFREYTGLEEIDEVRDHI